MDRFALRFAIAFIWLATGLGVLHPYYREVGRQYLEPLGLPDMAMFAACVMEVLLGLAVLLLSPRWWLTICQVALIAGFTVVLAIQEPRLLVNPFGVLSKNVSIISLIITAQLVEIEGWTARACWILRIGMAFIWFWEGLMVSVFFPSQELYDILAILMRGFPLGDPKLLLMVAGIGEAASGVAALVLRGRLLRVVLTFQILGLIVICLSVSAFNPLLWFHPFGPITKNIPLMIGTGIVWEGEASLEREVSRLSS
jgi:uncharacterized membrane protein YphA (DoxX/SURF4 family)